MTTINQTTVMNNFQHYTHACHTLSHTHTHTQTFIILLIMFFAFSVLEPNKIILYTYPVQLRWSRGSVLAFSTQVCGFKPGRSRRIFRVKKSTPSFGGEEKPSVPCRRFAAYKRSLNLCGSHNLGKITTAYLSRPQFHLSLLGSLVSLRTEAPGG